WRLDRRLRRLDVLLRVPVPAFRHQPNRGGGGDGATHSERRLRNDLWNTTGPFSIAYLDRTEHANAGADKQHRRTLHRACISFAHGDGVSSCGCAFLTSDARIRT